MWFTENAGNKIGVVTTSGSFNEYTVPTASSGPRDIRVGSDNNLWFTESNGNKIAKGTTTGTFTEYAVPTANSQPPSIAVKSIPMARTLPANDEAHPRRPLVRRKATKSRNAAAVGCSDWFAGAFLQFCRRHSSRWLDGTPSSRRRHPP